MITLARLTMLLAVCLILPACSSTSIVATVDPGQLCQSWREISTSKDDKLTPDTARQILGNNLGRQSAGCAREPIPPKAKPEAKTS
jgi:hypothetical protein